MSLLSPQLATPIELNAIGKYVVGDDWVLEQKLDGHRLMLLTPGADLPPAAITRNGTRYTRQLPLAVRKVRFPDDLMVALDGELIGGEYWVFDVLHADGSLNQRPLSERRAILETLLDTFEHPFKLVPQARTAAEKERLLLMAAAQNLEGVIAKRKDSPYRPGQRSTEWVKAKFVATADAVVLSVRDDGKESARLGICVDNGTRWLEVGRCSLLGKPNVEPGAVVEIRYLYVPDRASPRLFQPHLLRVRTDKTILECDGSDFKYASKTVLTSW
jgi:ATP-dependent DNA ligase